MQVKTPKQIMVLQNKAQKLTNHLNKEVVTIAKGIQHIQVQASTAYQLNTKDFNTKKLNLIAKKVGDDLEVALEESVIIFDNYFNVCTTDLSCLVSLPTKNGGLYHVVADIFFTLEDGSQVVYFYGEQSIVSTESSVVSTDDNQSFEDIIVANKEIVAVVAAVVVAVAVGSGSSDDNGNGGNDVNDPTDKPAAPTVDVITINSTEPVITGTTGTNAALASGESLSVTVSGATYSVIPNASGIWHLDLGVDTPTSGTLVALTNGSSYSVVATVSNAAGDSTTNVANDKISIDTTAPTFTSATVNGATLVLTCSEDLDATNIPTTGVFVFRVDNNTVEHAFTGNVMIDATAKTVTLTLANAIDSDASVMINYVDPTAEDDVNAIQDIAGNDVANMNGLIVVNNTVDTRPIVSATTITATDATGAVKTSALDVGDKIIVTVTMNKAVEVTGTPTYTINVGNMDKTATYISGSSSDTLVFEYTIVLGDNDLAGGITAGVDALLVASGVLIKGGIASSNAVLTTPAVTDNGSKAQWATGASASSQYNDSSYSASQVIGAPDSSLVLGSDEGDVVNSWAEAGGDKGRVNTITLTYDTAVFIQKIIVRETFNSGTITKVEAFKDGNFVAVYTKGATEEGGKMTGVVANKVGDTVITLDDALSYKSNKIRISIGNSIDEYNEIDAVQLVGLAELIVDTAVPTVSATAITATDSTGAVKTGILSAGDKIIVTVTMSEAVEVTGTPTYTINVGNTDKTATYISGSSSDTLVFGYTIVLGDNDLAGGITAGVDALLVASDTSIKDNVGHDAVLTTPIVTDNGSREQWAISAIASSQSANYNANQVIGAPDSSLTLGDNEAKVENSWAEHGDDRSKINTITLTYDTEVFIQKIVVREVFNSGDISRVEVFKDGDFTTIYTKSGTAETGGKMTGVVEGKVSDTEITLDSMLSYKSEKIRISVGSTSVNEFNLIDAVQLVGLMELAVDTTAPTFTSATVNGATLTLTCDEILDAGNAPATSAFIFKVAGSVVANAFTDAVVIDATAKTITLTLVNAVASNATVSISYIDPTAGDDTKAIQDIAGNDAVSTNDLGVTNNTVSIGPTLTITGSGGLNIDANIITFNFSEAIKNGSFTVEDIGIVNGSIVSDSFLRVNTSQYTAVVAPSLGGKHSNVAITVAADTFENIAGNSNVAISKNETSITLLKDRVAIGTESSIDDLTHWDVSHVKDATNAFFRADAFNQDISSWDVSNMIRMNEMFREAYSFNQDISSWDVSNVTEMSSMFSYAGARKLNFSQDLGSWDVSSLTYAEGMLATTLMSVDNMDNTLRGWAKLDTVAGETAIQERVKWDIANYTDVTARQYLIDTYNWRIKGTFDGSKTQQGDNGNNTLTVTATQATLHGLGGEDTLNGSAANDVLIGGAGDDLLYGKGGRDTFYYGFENAGNDSIDDFTVGVSTNNEADIIDLKDLLIGYNSTSLSNFITMTEEGANTKLTIDHDGAGELNSPVSILLLGVGYSATLLSDMIDNGNLVLE
ncbi:hypothetical protein THERMOT_413 [Bathymodiolus thermophilus thioautotrophic gill symbiont]|uniref:SwmB domain-containing protein n=1 Tax=Bathymodiolus thermophilus thioautotrophic gill symbiont TaxID=2360 RepID=UPI00192BFD25|nr:SwmB domain-containing protein [Bathymodiolus thermophilus thioautotrophic gill symbiont]CAB5495947.1 hypothetical protein THERMOT_413 [Bathymodiolus thermophilus thioautotrophic gill symbiont]